MGTFYSIVIYNSKNSAQDLQKRVDRELKLFNQIFSTYIPDSEISQFNDRESTEAIQVSTSFLELTLSAREIFDWSDETFDPTVMPLVNLWGFGPKAVKESPSKEALTQVLESVSMNNLTIDKVTSTIQKKHPKTQIDYSAIAKGYGVDAITTLLQELGEESFLVEIGGELRVVGEPQAGRKWKIGINRPDPKASSKDLQEVLLLMDRSMATSGNYRNYREEKGFRAVHTLDPRKGEPIQTDLLSATILANTCMEADALATAAMVLGSKEAIRLLEKRDGVGYYLVVRTEYGKIEHRKSRDVETVSKENSNAG